MAKAIRQAAKDQRTIECQQQCMTGFIYYQGVIDAIGDILDNIDKIRVATKKDKNGVETA
jgi:hypothetical protein